MILCSASPKPQPFAVAAVSMLAVLLTIPTTGIANAQSVTKPVLTAAPVQAPVAAAPAAGGAPAAISATATAATYLISPEDTLSVTVWKEPNLSGSFPVRPDGAISLALIGEIHAAGLTPIQLGTEIATRLKKFVEDPNVTVTVLGVAIKQVFLLGEVGHVGAIPITPDMSPLQAIAAAGGLSPYANAKKIYILRTEGGKQKKIPFNYKKALKDGNEQGVSLVPGDTIVVP